MNKFPKFHLIKHEDIEKFFFAGNFFFTIENPKTKNRFAFKIRRAKRDREGNKTPNSNMYFVSANTNRDNEHNYNYIGYILKSKKIFVYGKTSRVGYNSDYVKVFKWLFKVLNNNSIPEFIKIYHHNRCARCGKELSVPESIESRFGPECLRIILKGF